LAHGLKHLSGDATVDMQMQYDWNKPELWNMTGSLLLDSLHAGFHPTNLDLRDLRGRVSIRRSKGIDVTLEGFKGKINQSPFEINGKVTDIGKKTMALAGRTQVENLDLAKLEILVPALKPYRIGGELHMELNIQYPFADPLNTQLTGNIKAHDIAMQLNEYYIKEGNITSVIDGQTIDIKESTLSINDQKLQVSGQLNGLREPEVQLHLVSDNLDVGRLLSHSRAPEAPVKSSASANKSADSSHPVAEVTRNFEPTGIPKWLGNLSADLLAEISQGQYRKEEFRDLGLHVEYHQGTVKNFKLDVNIGGGRLSTQGSVDLRDLARIPYDLTPDMNGVKLESLSRLVGLDKPFMHGPISMNGRIRGNAGSKEELLAGLNGKLTAVAGPGRIQSKSTIGDRLFDLLSFMHIGGFLTGQSRDRFAEGGIPYDSLKINSEFQGGNMNIDSIKLATPAVNVSSTGVIDLAQQRLKMEMNIAVLKNADEVFGFVPLVGEIVKDMTEVHLEVKGPLGNPEMHYIPGIGVIIGIEDEAKKIGKDIKDIKGFFKRGAHHGEKKTAN
jgi:hypothetical protein